MYCQSAKLKYIFKNLLVFVAGAKSSSLEMKSFCLNFPALTLVETEIKQNKIQIKLCKTNQVYITQ